MLSVLIFQCGEPLSFQRKQSLPITVGGILLHSYVLTQISFVTLFFLVGGKSVINTSEWELYCIKTCLWNFAKFNKDSMVALSCCISSFA